LARYQALSPEDKAAAAISIARTRRLTEEERQALGVKDLNVADRIFTSLNVGAAKAAGKIASGIGEMIPDWLADKSPQIRAGKIDYSTFGKQGQEAATAFQNLYGQEGRVGRLAQQAGGLGVEMAGTLALPEGRLAHMVYWAALSGTKAKGEGKSWKEAAVDAAEALALLETGRPLGPVASEAGDAFSAQVTKLGTRAALGYASGYALARAQGASPEEAENMGLQFAAMSALPGKREREETLSRPARELSAGLRAGPEIAGATSGSGAMSGSSAMSGPAPRRLPIKGLMEG